MARCELDPSLERHEIDGFAFPLGVYPVEPMVPRAGYSVAFEPGDGDDEGGEWEEWPDRYVFDIVVPATRLEPMWRALLSQMPARVYPILDFIGHDAYREIDPYIAYELVGQDRMTDSVRRFAPFFFEDGMVGFGAVSDLPFSYVFLDEHKVFTVRVEPGARAGLEKILEAFELEELEEPAGSDAAAHEHRGVLLAPKDRPDLLTPEEIVEQLREAWQLVLNVDPESNVDDDGKDLGMTVWRSVVRCGTEPEGEHAPAGADRFGEVLLTASSLLRAEELAHEGAVGLLEDDGGELLDVMVLSLDRVLPEQGQDMLRSMSAGRAPGVVDVRKVRRERVLGARWLLG
ncbi:MAG: hypothetical protein ACF8Q5_02865 [Phycisphaerales bacterium JB040]